MCKLCKKLSVIKHFSRLIMHFWRKRNEMSDLLFGTRSLLLISRWYLAPARWDSPLRRPYSSAHRSVMLCLFTIPSLECISFRALTEPWLLDSWAGAKQGLLIRGGDVLERLAGVDVVALDKVLRLIISIDRSFFSCPT